MSDDDEHDDQLAFDDVDAGEVQNHIELVVYALEARGDERRLALTRGFARFGMEFYTVVRAAQQTDPQITVDAILALMWWFKGNAILGTVDESERRALVANACIDGESWTELSRFAADALLALPTGHAMRDSRKAFNALIRAWELCVGEGKVAAELSIMTTLLEHDLIDASSLPQLYERAEWALKRCDLAEEGRGFLVAMLHYSLGQARQTTDVRHERWIERAQDMQTRLSAIEGSSQDQAKNLLGHALLLDSCRETARAAELLRQARLSGGFDANTAQSLGLPEAQLRMALMEFPAVVELLEPCMAQLESAYVCAIDDTSIVKAGLDFADASIDLTFALARLGRCGEAARVLERSKSLRTRSWVGLRRRTRHADLLLKHEQDLYALERGVVPSTIFGPHDAKADRLAASVSVRARALEHFRRTWAAELEQREPDANIRDIAAALRPREAAVLLALGKHGTLALIITGKDQDEPSGWWRVPELSFDDVAAACVADNGWAAALKADGSARDPRQALDALTELLERELAPALVHSLREEGIERLVIVPHRIYDLVPWWALPSLADFPIVVAPSAAQFVDGARSGPREISRAVVVGDPTLDLPLSPAEVDVVCSRLQAQGVDCTQLLREAAGESVVADRVEHAQLFHFCGHGRVDMTDPRRSALLLYPDWSRARLAGAEDIEQLASNSDKWEQVGEEAQRTDVGTFGRLIEMRSQGSSVCERFLEYSERGTLWSSWRDDRCVQAAELWTAGDMLVTNSLSACELVFLSACSAGAEPVGRIEERKSLPSTLLAVGASTVVAAMWSVEDAASALFVDLFYERLAEADGCFDVVQCVYTLQRVLRETHRDAAIARLRGLECSDIAAQFEIDACIQRLRGGAEFPFRHPYDWASFHVLGRGEVMLRRAATDPCEAKN